MIVEILTPHTEVPIPQISIPIPHVIPIHIPHLEVPILQINILQIDHIPLDVMTTTPPHMIKDHILLIDMMDKAFPQTNMKAIPLIEVIVPIPLIGDMKAIPLIEVVVPIPLISMTIDLETEEEMIGPSMKGQIKNLDMILEKGVLAPDQVLLIPQGLVPLLGTMRKSASQTFLKTKVGDPKD